jgi:hypothetical protein
MLEQPPLAGPLARIDRADELTLQLTASCNAFLATRPYTVEERPDENPATRAFLITALREVPLLPRIIAGEVAHHLRASLDLMVYQMMLKSGVTDAKLLKKSVFPVLDKDLSTAQGRGEYHAAIKKAIGPLPVTPRARIEALQPCNTNHAWSHLAQLQRLDNTQKHRLLLAATSSIRIGGWNFRDEHGNVTTLPHHSFIPLQVDALLKVANARPGFVLPNLAHEVAFMEPGPVFGHPVDHILRNLSKMTRETVSSFSDCF